jgi:DNA repair protein RadD
MNAVLAPSECDDGFPEPRAFQIDAHQQLRQGFREGHKNQLIMAPTGLVRHTLDFVSAMKRCKRVRRQCSCVIARH